MPRMFAVAISTHALTWSATKFHSLFTPIQSISTHVECDAIVSFCSYHSGYFNSRTHVECDCQRKKVLLMIVISTHALTWSATMAARMNGTASLFQLTHSRGVRRCVVQTTRLLRHFNSRTHVECDGKSGVPMEDLIKFQLTHSRGVRRSG